jgi:hypothetical protein
MSTINTSDSKESSEWEKNKKNSGNIQSLLSESVEMELKNSNGVIDPILLDGLKYPEIYMTIRDKMKFVRDTEDENFSEITDSDVINISDAKILEKIEKFARPLKNARRNLYSNIRKVFPNIREKIPGLDEWMLFQKIEALDENEITKLYSTNRKLAEFLHQYFYVSRESLLFRDYDFMSVFGTDNLRNTSPDLYQRTESAAIGYKKSWANPELSLIRELIGFYGNGNKEKKKEICEFFNVHISLPDAVRFGFISENEIETIAEVEFAHIWNTLDPETKKSLIQILKNDRNYDVDLATFDINTIDRYFSSTKMKDILSRGITNTLIKNDESPAKTSGFTKDLVPEIGEDGIPRIHNPFLQLIRSKITGSNWISKIQKIENLRAWSVLAFADEAEKVRYFKINDTDIDLDGYDHGVSISDITGKEENSIWNVKDTSKISYDDLYRFLLNINSWKVLNSEEIASIKTSDKNDAWITQDPINGDGKILDVSDTEDVLTLEGFIREINIIDPDGEKIGIESGVSFASKWVLESGEEYDGIWNISAINPPNISISNKKFTETTTLDAFLEVAKTKTFRRIAKLGSQEDFLHALGDFGVDGHAHIKGDKLVLEHDNHHDDHGHDDHDSHGGHGSKEKVYDFFQSKSGGHIRINGFSDGLVSFGEYVSWTALAEVQKKWNAGKLSKKEKAGLYANTTMSYGEFIDYLKKNDLKATTDNLLVPNATDSYHPHDPHFENDFGSFMSKVGSWWSIADMMKGFSNLTHGIEHYFEKSSKLNASRFALWMWRKMWLPLDIMAQLQADEVSGVKEIIEKIQEKFKNLNGPIWRKKALHIAHNKNARPEEVGAAILHMVKWYGSLYAEDIAYAQWSESFINGLLTSCGFTWQALTDMKIKAREKSKVLLGNEAGSDLSEEEMIWGFMKMMDGNYEKYPIAATLVKAMGGPSGFENAWRKDGFEGAYEKWLRQSGDLVNAEARVDHGLSALSTHEYHTAIWSMEKAADKDPSPGIQTLPVVWALGWYSKYLSTKANQKIKWFADGKWHSLHAFSFLRSRTDNDLYRYTFREALKKVAPAQEVDKLDKWIKDLEYDGHTQKWDKVKVAVNWLASIWRKYHNKWLHDMLQWKNMWLIENANHDPMIKKYFEHLGGVHQNNSGDTAHSDDNGWYIQHGYVWSPIVNAVNDEHTGGYTLNSFDRTLRKIHLDSQSFSFRNKDHVERYWDPIVKIVKNLDRGSQDEKLKKAQFLQYRRDILLRLNESFSARWSIQWWLQAIKKQAFYTDLLNMGIDMSIILESWSNINKKIDKTAEKDYQAWKQWGHRWGSATSSEIQSVSDTVASTISSRYDAGFQWKWRNQDLRKDPDFNTSDHPDAPAGRSDLWDGSWAD